MRAQQSYIEELKRNYEDEKYYYEQYNEKAEKEFEQADVEKRYAEDYEWKYNEFNDESYNNQAQSCYRSSEHHQNEGNRLKNEANWHLDKAQQYKRSLEAEGVYL